MLDALILGGGPAGLAAALLAARRGHAVAVVEQDEGPSGVSAEHDFRDWTRQGVAQARQGHIFLARSTEVLREEAPDVLAAVLARGAVEVPLAEHGLAANVLARRIVYEAVLRRIAQHEPNLTFIRSRVERLSFDTRKSIPRVVGAWVAGHGELRANVVVDATGRRSKALTWLAAHALKPPYEFTQPCGFFYVTRHYKLKAGAAFPSREVPIVAPLDYVTVLAFPADNGCFQLSLTVSTEDPYRQRLLDPDVFDRVLEELPLGKTWLSCGEPTDEPKAMAKIENRRRSLVVDDVPVVSGLVLLGDASIQTNPTTGRGISFAFAQAQHLARALERAADDAPRFVLEVERWTAQHLGIWFDGQVAIDTVRSSQLSAGVRGQSKPPPEDPTNRWIAGLAALSKEDPLVRSAVRRLYNLLTTPAELMADRSVSKRVLAFLRAHPVIDIRPVGPSRADFEQIVSA